jgi:putative transposase
MTYPRLQYPGALFHVMTRGNERRRTFRSPQDYRHFLSLLGEAVDMFRWILYTYALMPNHVHLLLQLTEANFSIGMHWLDGEYAKYFNRRYGRVGHFFQGRPHAPLVEKDTYFLTLLRYIALNPVDAKLCARPEQYEWSAHRALSGRISAPSWLATDDALIAFAPKRDVAQRLYTNFVDEGIGQASPIDELETEEYMGSKEWLRSIREKLELEPRIERLTLKQRRVGRPDEHDIVNAVAATLGQPVTEIRFGHADRARMLAAWLGSNEGLLKRSEIASVLRVSESGVRRLLVKCERELANDLTMRECLDATLAKLRSSQ